MAQPNFFRRNTQLLSFAWQTHPSLNMNANPVSEDLPSILIVNDDKSMRMRLRLELERDGYRVLEAKNGEEGLAAYKQHQPDMVVLDAAMPVMDGFTCCTQLRSLPGSDRTAVLIVEVVDTPGAIEQVFAVGATDYVTKPINWTLLRQRVSRLLQQSVQTKTFTSVLQQLEVANRELQNLVYLDSLTLVSNRRFFEEYLNREWRRMARDRSPLSLILVEIDDFKRYNSTYGEPAGNSCLQRVADAISRTAKRPADLVARYQESAFAVILPQTTTEGAVHVAELIRLAVQGLKIAHTYAPTQYVTLSCGVASTTPNHESSPEILLTAAQQAVSRAQAQGCDRVIPIKI